MKKVVLLVMCLVLAIANGCMAKDKKVKPENLPLPVRQFIKQIFPATSITAVTQEVDDKDFNITLSNGTKLEFGKNNQWSEIYNRKAIIPSNLIPQKIVSYVNQKYPKAAIIRIERCSQGYDIDLNNRKHFQLNTKFQPTKFKEAD